MQKKLIALAVAGLASSGAFAQSNVEITGNVDMSVVSMTGSYSGQVGNTVLPIGTAGLTQTNGVFNGVGKSGHSFNGSTQAGASLTEYGSRNELQSAQRSTSKITFRGTEDLGGGLKAFFDLTSNIAGDGGTANGSNTTPGSNILGNRTSLVGLTGSWGTAKFGRMTIMADDSIDPFTNNGIGGYGNMAILPVATRYNNVIHLESPKFWDATLIYQYAMAENSDRLENTLGQGSVTNMGVYYAAGPLEVRAHHLIARDYGNGLTANVTPQAGAAALSTTATGGYTPAQLIALQHKGRSLHENYIAGTYDFGVAKLFATYMTTMSTKTASDASSASATAAQIACINSGILCWVGYEAPMVNSATYSLGINVPFGAHAFQAALTGTNDKRVFNQDGRQAAIGYTYAFSKRTEFYARGAKVYNTNGSTYSVTGGGGTLIGNVRTMGTAGTDATTLGRTTGYVAGINHKF